MKYFMNIDILHNKLFVISKYGPTSNSNVNTVVTDIHIVDSSFDSDSSNEVYNLNNNIYNNSNSAVNNSNSIDSENRNINISDSINNSIDSENRNINISDSK